MRFLWAIQKRGHVAGTAIPCIVHSRPLALFRACRCIGCVLRKAA